MDTMDANVWGSMLTNVQAAGGMECLTTSHSCSLADETPSDAAGSATLLVSRLPESADSKVLKAFLVGSGFQVECATVIRHKDGGSRCFGFVKFSSHQEALKAITTIDTFELQMRDGNTGAMWKIDATWAKSDTGRPFGRAGK
jgi:hypothetical protein